MISASLSKSIISRIAALPSFTGITISRKDKSGYTHAIDVWTVRDVNKRNIAKYNNLNYLEIFSIKKEEIIEKFEEYIKIKNFNI